MGWGGVEGGPGVRVLQSWVRGFRPSARTSTTTAMWMPSVAGFRNVYRWWWTLKATVSISDK